MMEEFMNEEKKITSQFDNDPINCVKIERTRPTSSRK
jgi:hypothetical protein